MRATKVQKVRRRSDRHLLTVGLGVFLAVSRAYPTPAAPPPAPTPSAREALRKTIEPVVDAFSRAPDGPNRAFALRLRVEEASNQPPELRGTTLLFRAEAAPANKVLFQFGALGTVITICRQDQAVWAAPASVLAPLLQRVEASKPSQADQEPLAPLHLKIPTRLFWLLFYLEGVHDAGSEPLGAVSCRRLDLDPPDGGKVGPDKYLRLWVRPDSWHLARIDWKSSPADHGTLVVEDSHLAPELPPSDFYPDAAQRADLLDIPMERFRAFMKLLGQEEDKRQKAQQAQQAVGRH